MMPKMELDAVGYIHYRERSPHSKIRRGEWEGDDRYRGRWIRSKTAFLKMPQVPNQTEFYDALNDIEKGKVRSF